MWLCRHFTIADSDLVVNAAQLASIVADFEYVVPAGGMTGSIVAHAVDTVNAQVDYDGDLALLWTLTEGGNVGSIEARSMSSVASGPVYNVTSVVDYGNNAYFTRTAETISNFLVSAEGGYGGNQFDW